MIKYLKYILFLLLITFVYNTNVMAEECDAADMARLKKLAKNIEVSYEYLGIDESERSLSSEKYNITISGVSNELTIGLGNADEDELYYESKNGNIEFSTILSKVSLNVYKISCSGQSLRKIEVDLPRFNQFSDYTECEKLKDYNLSVCDPWYQGELTDDDFFAVVNPYLKKEKVVSFPDKVLDFILKNYIFFIFGGILLIVLIVVAIRKHRERSVLD